VAGCEAIGADGFRVLPELLEQFRELGCDVVEMVLADQNSWDRYVAAQWLNTRAGWTHIPTTNWPARCARNSPPLRHTTPDTDVNTSAGCLRADEPLTPATG
jgi:hypothetical protein